MANTPKASEKISADCPHCGFSQLESAFAKSTFCRKCGQHYSIEKLLAKEVASLKGPSIFDKLSKMVAGEKVRDICCFSCGLAFPVREGIPVMLADVAERIAGQGAEVKAR